MLLGRSIGGGQDLSERIYTMEFITSYTRDFFFLLGAM
jgi:hypothetical protein